MRTVTSKDGTRIAFEQFGQGPALILITGALGTRSEELIPGQLPELLSHHFTVIDYDRRGRGDSSDTLPYAVEREVEDIEVLIDAVGGSSFLYGISSGGVLALEATSHFPNKVKKLAIYEPPFIIDDSRPPVPGDYVEQLDAAISAGKPGDAVEIFMTKAILIPAEFVNHMKNAQMGQTFGEDGGMQPPGWTEMEKVAHTLAYDGMVMGETMSGKPLPPKKWFTNNAPTLVVTGGNSDAFFHTGAKALVNDLPYANHYILEGQDHAVNPGALAPVLIAFFGA